MADDIDIEEHDVLDNPTIKDMFPDISVLKQEIKMFEEDFQKLNNGDSPDEKSTKATHEVKDDDVIIVESYLFHDAKAVSNDLVTNCSGLSDLEGPINANRIILGSKPSKKFEYEEEFFEERVKSYNINVVLDDMKSYLDTSGRFCDECLILFPKENSLRTHMENTHKHAVINKSKSVKKTSSNDLEVEKKFKCHKCNIHYASQSSLCRHNRTIHSGIAQAQRIQKMITRVKTDLQQDQHKPNDTTCFHCDNSFPTQKSLVEHLYSILQSKYLCEVCSKQFTNSEELLKHTVNHKECFVVLEKIPDHIIEERTENPKIDQIKQTQQHILTTEANDAVKLDSAHNDIYFYRCYICSYYFKTSKHYMEHLVKKHNVIKHYKDMEVEVFDDKCQFCDRVCKTVMSHNVHLSCAHKKYVNKWIGELDKGNSIKSSIANITAIANLKQEVCHVEKYHNETEDEPNLPKFKQISNDTVTKSTLVIPQKLDKTKILVLKSAFFKCSKCDIHFLSSKTARNHSEHIEMLINWKCDLCKKIFKMEDKDLHEEQHMQSKNLTVHDLCPVASSPVLYQCPKCTVHFKEENFLEHHSICENVTVNSVFCIICDILIDNTISKSHRSDHVSNNLQPTDFIIVSSDILENNCKSKLSNCRAKEFSSSSENRKNNTMLKRNYKSSHTPQKKPKDVDNLLNFTYCSRCKCFLTEIDNRELHNKQFCQYVEKCICKICGLTLTAQSFEIIHRSLHNIMNNAKLKDYKIYDIKSGKQISPPIPEYTKCKHCNIHYLCEDDNVSHECSKTDYLTCHICNINLTENAFTLHMVFHNCSKTNVKDGFNNYLAQSHSQLNSFPKKSNKYIVKEEKTKGIMIQPDKKNSKKKIETKKMSTKPVNKSNYKCLEIPKTSTNTVEKGNDKSLETRNTSSKPEEKRHDVRKTKRKVGLQLSDSKKSKEIVSHEHVTEKNLLKQINLDGLLYQCINCSACVDTYDKVIEHCIEHYSNKENEIETAKCQICDIALNGESSENHRKLHLIHKSKDFFTILYFDVFFFTSENKIWIEHVFGTIPTEQRNKIIQDSIYKYECRIKMEVIQNGPTDLTVYKCDKCRNFIDGVSIYKHAENSCFKLRQHPCSVCGLPFNSSVARIEHEKIHDRPNINLKSYRIVTFNKEEDKSLNKLLFNRSQVYVLYQCRNCSVVFDKSQVKNHKCCDRNIKACSACGLLFTNQDYDNHILRHSKLTNFVQKNIKIVLFGETTENVTKYASKKVVSSFSGLVYDYTFYSCSKCKVCLKADANFENHTCSFGTNRLKCSLCKLYFLTSRLKHHIKLHETNPDFLRENMRVLIFNSSEEGSIDFSEIETVEDRIEPATICGKEVPKNNGSVKKCIEGIDMDTQPKLSISNNEEMHRIIPEKESNSAKIYKCFCGLHFIEDLSFIRHVKVCDEKSRAVKQKCAKCDLLFTTDILFNHLIMHHGDKSQHYKFKIIDMAKNKIIYRCIKCKLHFVKMNDINKHFDACDEATEGKDCIFCHLKFESFSFLYHDCNNVNNVNAGIEVLDLCEPLVPKTGFLCEEAVQFNTEATSTSSEQTVRVEPLPPKTGTLCGSKQQSVQLSVETLSTPVEQLINRPDESFAAKTGTLCENKQKSALFNVETTTMPVEQLFVPDKPLAAHSLCSNKQESVEFNVKTPTEQLDIELDEPLAPKTKTVSENKQDSEQLSIGTNCTPGEQLNFARDETLAPKPNRVSENENQREHFNIETIRTHEEKEINHNHRNKYKPSRPPFDKKTYTPRPFQRNRNKQYRYNNNTPRPWQRNPNPYRYNGPRYHARPSFNESWPHPPFGSQQPPPFELQQPPPFELQQPPLFELQQPPPFELQQPPPFEHQHTPFELHSPMYNPQQPGPPFGLQQNFHF